MFLYGLPTAGFGVLHVAKKVKGVFGFSFSFIFSGFIGFDFWRRWRTLSGKCTKKGCFDFLGRDLDYFFPFWRDERKSYPFYFCAATVPIAIVLNLGLGIYM